jgi:lipid II:glycine glycyltransferase (peptidoglycan interpeptide bridge formation enzyme)
MDNLSELFTSNKRNDIRKAIKSNVVVEIDNSKEAKDFLLTTHLENMATIGGIAKSESLFNSLYDTYVENKDYNIFIAKKDGESISGLLVLYFNEITEYYTPVTVKEFREFQPLALVIYEAMRFSVGMGCTSWNWGGNGLSLDGVYKFKQRWGAKDYNYNYYIKLNDKRLLGLEADALLNEYLGFFTVPFQLLNSENSNG